MKRASFWAGPSMFLGVEVMRYFLRLPQFAEIRNMRSQRHMMNVYFFQEFLL